MKHGEIKTVKFDKFDVTLTVPGEEPSKRKSIPWWKTKRGKYGMIAGACALVIVGGGIAIAANQPSPASDGTNQSGKSEQVLAKTPHDIDVSRDVNVTLDLPKWSDTSTPALLEVNDGVSSTYTLITYDKAKDTKLTLDKGTYTLTLFSPINSDGSIYIVNDPKTLNVNAKSGNTLTASFTGTKLLAENVTEAQINAIKDAFNEAHDAGKVSDDVVSKVNDNANAGKDARNSKSDEEKKAAQEAAKQETQNKQESDSSDSDSSSSENSSEDSSSESTTNHQHSWTPVYKTVHHDAVTHTENVYGTYTATICTVCGADITGNTVEHTQNHISNNQGYGWRTEERQGVTGQKTVVDKPAWDERVIDHYSCSCGATK